MGKALVLQNVNFSANKLDTVTIGENVPCTGIALSQNSIEFSALTSTTLTAVLTPSNTTDHLLWSSSDDSVATVADGVVTATGLGTATITATCGSQSATCSVSVEVTLTIDNFEVILHKTQSISASDLANGKDYMGSYGSSAEVYQKYTMVLSDKPTAYKALSGTDETYDGKYVFVIPNNATKIEIAATGISTTSLNYANSKEQPTYGVTGKGTKLVAIGTTAYASSGKCVNTIPDNVTGLDSFIATVVYARAIEAIPSDLTITFKEE